MKYAVVIEEGPKSFGAYVPDLPGCIAVGESRTEAVRLIGVFADIKAVIDACPGVSPVLIAHTIAVQLR